MTTPAASGTEATSTPLTLPLGFDARAIEKRVGLILLATDHSTEADFRRLVASDRVGLLATRIAYANPVTPENLAAMEPRLASAAALILSGRRSTSSASPAPPPPW